MRILQLIDSLRPGGAEKMAVNYANALAKKIDGSFLCSTRAEGLLKKQLAPEVGYLFLKKQSSLDLKAFIKLRRFVRENQVEIIQAHGSSWYFGVLLKISVPKLKLVWHDHYGKELHLRNPGLLKPASKYFDAIISVNGALKDWAEKKLETKNVIFKQNFFENVRLHCLTFKEVRVRGNREDFKIFCLANLRPQKDHINLFQAFDKLIRIKSTVSLHLIGKEEDNPYSLELRRFLKQHNLENKVYFYGERENIMGILTQADLGVLSSSSEGLPVALLEYGLAGLPVVCTRVGECEAVVGGNGRVVAPKDSEALFEALRYYIENEIERTQDSVAFQKRIVRNYSEEQVVKELLEFFRNLINSKVR